MTLGAHYRGTLFQAGPVRARVGRRSASADAWLAARGAREGAMLTAWNPMSRRHPEGWNARRQAALRDAVRRLPQCEGWSGANAWWEHNLLLPADARRLVALARRFRQRAILLLRRGQPARIIWLG